jgi:hypothetical protein
MVEELPVRVCVRRGQAVDLVLDRARESRSQIIFTTVKGLRRSSGSRRRRRGIRGQLRGCRPEGRLGRSRNMG